MAEFVKVAKRSEVPPGTLKAVQVNGVAVVLCNVDGSVYALRDECTHEAFPLSAGMLHGKLLTCALHGAQFDCTTGRVEALPAFEAVQTFAVKLEGEDIHVAAD
jgi:3-phenylpropionate/trans-cinnamate dioxygenase ferredoxin subunit